MLQSWESLQREADDQVNDEEATLLAEQAYEDSERRRKIESVLGSGNESGEGSDCSSNDEELTFEEYVEVAQVRSPQ